MSPLRLELISLSRSRGGWLAFAVACGPAAFALAAMVVARHRHVQPEALARLWWPMAFTFATMAQAALLPILQVVVLGDSLAGQVADRRMRSLALTPAGTFSLYAGKLGAAFAFALATLIVSLALHSLGAAAAVAGSDSFGPMASRGYHTAIPSFALVFLAAQLALATFEGFVFSIAPTLKSGLVGVAALTASLLAVQVAATRAPESWGWLGHATFTYHYFHAMGSGMLTAAATAKLALNADCVRSLAALGADVLVFGSLGYWGFRRREI